MSSRTAVTAVAIAALASLAPASLAGAAEAKQPDAAPKRTAVYLQAGLSSGSYDMGGAALGGTIVRDLGSRLAVEGSGAFLTHGMASNAVSLSASLLLQLRPRAEKVVPYLAGGGGLYRTSFEMGGRRSGSMGGMMGYGMMGWGPGASRSNVSMPMFYAGRLAGRPGWQSSGFGRESFTDPAVNLGGGLRIDLGSRVFLRPDARALIVAADGGTHTVGVFTINVGYGF